MRASKEHADRIDLLFSDMMLPDGFTGVALAAQFRAAKPGLRVIISSGYSAEHEDRSKLDSANLVFLQKPYEIARLANTVRESLAGR